VKLGVCIATGDSFQMGCGDGWNICLTHVDDRGSSVGLSVKGQKSCSLHGHVAQGGGKNHHIQRRRKAPARLHPQFLSRAVSRLMGGIEADNVAPSRLRPHTLSRGGVQTGPCCQSLGD
jgi:hypothetical protein